MNTRVMFSGGTEKEHWPKMRQSSAFTAKF